MSEQREAQPDEDGDLIEVNSVNEIPNFATEEEEHRFWSTHALGPALFGPGPCIPEALLPPKRRTAARFGERQG